MHIDSYEFGRIVIGDREYTQDVIIYPDRVRAEWWRREGHYLHEEDLAEILEHPPEVLIIGQGFSGFMEVPETLVSRLESLGIRVHVSNTRDAVATYNQLNTIKGVVAALHLTC